ncbi:hypothetical protein DFJ74DRAFT_755311, partial [Hyaloraphidium curvatum]
MPPKRPPERSNWGFGREDGIDRVPPAAVLAVGRALSEAKPALRAPRTRVPRPWPSAFVETARGLRPPRIDASSLPPNVAAMCSSTGLDRLRHNYGCGPEDVLRGGCMHFPSPPDLVAYPKSEDDVIKLLDWCAENCVHVVPFGGGTSGGGAVEPMPNALAGAIAVDLTRHMDRVLAIDEGTMTARVQAGATGQLFLAQLEQRTSGRLTFAALPEAWEYSTVGGWIATRAYPQFSHTDGEHVAQHAVALKVATPAGVRDVAVQDGEDVFVGSEGALGIITEVTLRLQPRATQRASCTFLFETLEKGLAALQAIAESGLNPTEMLLTDPSPVAILAGRPLGTDPRTTIRLAFPTSAAAGTASRLLRSHAGVLPPPSDVLADPPPGQPTPTTLPYLRDALLLSGIVSGTLEFSCPWAQLAACIDGAMRVAEREGALWTLRVSRIGRRQAYPSLAFAGPARYDSPAGMAKQWGELRAKCAAAIVEAGGRV